MKPLMSLSPQARSATSLERQRRALRAPPSLALGAGRDGFLAAARRCSGLVALGLLFFLLPAQASAQGYYPGSYYNRFGTSYPRMPGVPFQRPTFSPYLNILNGGVNPGINYYGLVRPQIDFRNTLLQQQQQIAMGDQSLADQAAALSMMTTGHPSMFMSHRRYFLTTSNRTQGAQLGSTGGAGMQRPTSGRGRGSTGSPTGSARRGY